MATRPGNRYQIVFHHVIQLCGRPSLTLHPIGVMQLDSDEIPPYGGKVGDALHQLGLLHGGETSSNGTKNRFR